MMSSLSRWFRSPLHTAQNRATGRKKTACKPHLEALEDRIVPATTVYFDDFINTLAADSLGNQYVTFLRLHGPVDLDPDPARTSLAAGLDFTQFGGNSQFMVKYSPSHEVLWVKSAAANQLPGWVFDLKVATDPGGVESLYAFGESVTKMNLDGGVVWSTAPVALNPNASGVIDADGSIYTNVGGSLARLAADGTLQWSRAITSTATVALGDATGRGGAIAVANGVVHVGGMFTGNLSLGGLTDQKIDSASSSADGFLAAYDTNGNFQSVAHFIDAKVSSVRAVGSDVYLTAQFGYTADLDPGSGQKLLTPGSINGDNLAIARLAYNTAPTPTWTLSWANKLVSSGSSTIGYGMEVSGGDLYVSGEFGSTTDFDPSSGTYNLTADGGAIFGGDIFAMKLNAATGGLAWVSQMGSTRLGYFTPYTEIARLALTPDGIYLGGNVWHGTVNFVGPDHAVVKIMDAGLDRDAFMARLGTDGSYQWSFGVGAAGRTMDDGDPGYTESGSGWKNSSLGWDGESRTHVKGNGSNKATWTFTGLPNGTYQVVTLFPSSNKNASNAPFRVNGTLVTVDQRTAPNDFIIDGSEVWENVGTFAVTNGTLTVVLSDAANGAVVADAMRIWCVAPLVSPLLAAGGPVTSNPNTQTLTASALQPIVQEAIARWQAAGLSAAQRAVLQSVSIQIAELGGTTLGLAAGNSIWIDDNAAGWGWFVDRTPTTDSEFTTSGDQGEQNRMDLLTVVMHEMGHVLGLDHDADGLMGDVLALGTREEPVTTMAIDAVFASPAKNEALAIALVRGQTSDRK